MGNCKEGRKSAHKRKHRGQKTSESSQLPPITTTLIPAYRRNHVTSSTPESTGTNTRTMSYFCGPSHVDEKDVEEATRFLKLYEEAMSDPIPSASADHNGQGNARPVNAEDRQAAAALSSLNPNEIGAVPANGRPACSYQDGLGQAMSRLEISPKNNAGGSSAKKPVRVSEADVRQMVCIRD